jgi:hypothetical protein
MALTPLAAILAGIATLACLIAAALRSLAGAKKRVEVVTGITMVLKSQQEVVGKLRACLQYPLDQTA